MIGHGIAHIIGHMVGGCRLQRLIRHGTGGSLYEALDLLTGQVVAVKVFSRLPFVVAANQGESERLWKVVCGLDHPGIVPITRFGCEGGQHYAVMEHAGEGDLNHRLIPMQRLEIPRVLLFVRQILLALDCLHGRGYLHLDVKPGNLLLYAGERLKLSDFALLHPVYSSMRTVMGTPGSMSPEQIMGLTLDQRSDLFAVGVILYRMMTGYPAFVGTDAADRLNNTLLVTPANPSHILPHRIAPSLSQVVLCALAKRPSQRFPSAKEFLLSLENAVAAAGSEWRS